MVFDFCFFSVWAVRGRKQSHLNAQVGKKSIFIKPPVIFSLSLCLITVTHNYMMHVKHRRKPLLPVVVNETFHGQWRILPMLYYEIKRFFFFFRLWQTAKCLQDYRGQRLSDWPVALAG